MLRSSSVVAVHARRRRTPRTPDCRQPTVCLALQHAHHMKFHGFYDRSPPITFLIYVFENFLIHRLLAYFSNVALVTFSTRRGEHFLRNEHIRIGRAQLRIVLQSRARSLNLSIRQNHDNDCARMLSCRNSKHFHLNIPPPFRRTRASLSALTHTPLALPVLNYVRCKNCVSVFRRRPYIRRVHHRNIVISVVYSFTVTRNIFCFVFFI